MASLPIRLFSINLLNSVAMTANRVSLAQDIGEAANYAVQYSFTGTTPVGNLLIEGSADGILFSTIKTIAISGASGNGLDSESNFGYLYLRVTYSFTSGTGTLTVNASAKRG